MKVALNYFLLACAIMFAVMQTSAQAGFYNTDSIQTIEISFSQPNWDYQLDTLKSGSDGYLMADWVKINGQQFDTVGVKYKGNSSYDSTYTKNSLHIALDEFRNQSYGDFTDIKLGNGYADPSLIREVLSYHILSHYMECPRANFVRVYINGQYWGIYSNAENIDKQFCGRHFYSTKNTFVKCNPILNPGPATKSNLKYINSDSSSYFNFYEIKSKYGWNDLVALCDSVTNQSSSLEKVVDVDRLIWMLAFNNVLVNLDSYSGVFAQNYYLYKDNTNHFNPITWDLNMSLGGFPYLGNLNSSMGTLTITNQQQLSPTAHAADPYWPLINAIMNNPMYKRMYIAHMRTIATMEFAGGDYLSTANQMQTLIASDVQSDSNKFFSYAQFQNSLSTGAPFGSYSVPGIQQLMSARITYLQSTSEFTAVPPTITNVAPSNSHPAWGSTVTITANVTNAANGVYLGSRTAKTDKFLRTAMYDDGNHNDGAAGDNVYGIQFTVNAASTQYYVYAENVNAGIFLPERAEFETYTLYTGSYTPSPGSIVINEIMADDSTGVVDEDRQHADWIELYNTTDSAFDLSYLYLTDDINTPMKSGLASGAIIAPHGFYTVFADDENVDWKYLHTSFNLNSSGEFLMLSNSMGKVFDSLSFGQQTADVSFGRCPDGIGAFSFMAPTFNNFNCPTGINSNANAAATAHMRIQPNPANETAYIFIEQPVLLEMVEITDLSGQPLLTLGATAVATISTNSLANGVYLVRYNNEVQKLVIQH
ncbi:MAG: CotH kinase family protein [Chitinophagales bacterium]